MSEFVLEIRICYVEQSSTDGQHAWGVYICGQSRGTGSGVGQERTEPGEVGTVRSGSRRAEGR